MIVYPSVLPSTGQAFNLASNNAYNPQNDILISIEYAISGNINSEAGISFFLLSDASSFSGGVSGADLSYSGYYNGAARGISTAVVGLGFDSVGAFGLSAGEYYSDSNPLSGTLSAFYRDGYEEADIIPNSIAVRGGRTDLYSMTAVNSYYKQVSNYNLIGEDLLPKYLRFRVGNVARTLYLDAKDSVDECYKQLCAVDIGDYIDTSVFYRIGLGFTSPVSANNINATTNFWIKKIHVEGLFATLTSLQPLIEFWENVLPLWPDVGETWSL